VHLIDARLDEDGTRIGFDDGDTLVLVARGVCPECSGERLVPVSVPRVVAGGKVSWEAAEIRLPIGDGFGWAAIGDDRVGGEVVILSASFRDEFTVFPNTEYVIIMDGVER
jgi:hypothetical protein